MGGEMSGTAQHAFAYKLNAAVRRVLDDSRPAAVVWGADLAVIPNDAFSRLVESVGGRTRVGGPMRETSDALHERLEPLLRSAIQLGRRGQMRDELFCSHEHGFAEEILLTFTCSPVGARKGGGVGALLTIEDTTAEVRARRRESMLADLSKVPRAECSRAEYCARAIAALGDHTSDLPFALLYLAEPSGDRLRLMAASQLAPGGSASPRTIALGSSPRSTAWPVSAVVRSNRPLVVTQLVERFGVLPSGGWLFAPVRAMLVPIILPGAPSAEGVLIAGISA